MTNSQPPIFEKSPVNYAAEFCICFWKGYLDCI